MVAIIPVAGFGTRMLPASKSIPKEMLTLLDKPLIQYVVEEAYSAGIRKVVLVTHASKSSIENHFDTNFELEWQLEAKDKNEVLNSVRSVCPNDLNICAVRQSRGLGLGHAILCAQDIVGSNDFVVLLPDVLINHYLSNLAEENLAAMIKRFENTSVGQVMVEPVQDDDIEKYGIADLDGKSLLPGNSCVVSSFLEKPSKEQAPSNYAVVGRYVLPPSIWALLEKTKPGAGGEIQLTDAIDKLIETEKVEAFHITGKSHDCGNKTGYVSTFLEFAQLDPRF
ncbi:UTP--glucose-1-phosphate uridylyltransferase GalU [Kangiella marina]